MSHGSDAVIGEVRRKANDEYLIRVIGADDYAIVYDV